MALSYAFDPSKGETPETIARRRQTADLIASRIFGKAPANVGEGLNAIGQALIARQMQGEATDAQQAGMASVPALFGGTGANPAAGIAASIAGQPPVTPSAAVASSPMGNIPPPVAPTTGKIYSNDEPSPLDPPSGQDRQAMIATILGEAGNQGPTGMNAVGSVIRNRAVSGSFGGDTPTGVVTAKNQFEPWNTAEGRARMARAAADPRQAAAADAAIASAYGEGGQAPNDPTNGATMFFDPKLQASLGRQVPPWAQGPGQDIGDHRFFGGAPMQPTQVADAGNAIPAPMSGGMIGNAPPADRQAMAFAGPTAPQPLASPAGAPPAAPANDGEDALPANAAPAQGALPTAQAVQAATPGAGGPFPSVSTEDLTKYAMNQFVPAANRQVIAAEITRRATAAQQANDPLRRAQLIAAQRANQPVGEPYHDADGNLVQKDALGKVSVLSAADKAPNSVSEYKFYKDSFQPTPEQPKPMDYATFSTAKSRAGATNINNNVDLNGGQTYDKQLAEGLGKAHAALANGVEGAQARARDMAAMQGAIDTIQRNGGTTGGMGQQQILELKKTINSAAGGLGITTPFSENDISDKEFLTKFNRQIAGAQAKDAVGSRVTNFEMANYLKANPGLDMSITGNQRLIGIQSQIEQRNIAVGNQIRDATAEAIANGKKVDPRTVQKIITSYDDQHHITDPVNGQDLTQSYALPEFQKTGMGTNSSMAVGHEQNINGIKIKRIN